MKRLIVTAAIGTIVLGAISAAIAGDPNTLRATLSGYQEVPSLSTTGRGTFTARLSPTAIRYELNYSGLEGTAAQAHIHFGERHTEGGVSAFLCGGGGKPACPRTGRVTGTITAADVLGPADQGIEARNLVELIRAMRAGATYVNVHTAKFPDGEIRGQIASDDSNAAEATDY